MGVLHQMWVDIPEEQCKSLGNQKGLQLGRPEEVNMKKIDRLLKQRDKLNISIRIERARLKKLTKKGVTPKKKSIIIKKKYPKKFKDNCDDLAHIFMRQQKR